MFAFDAYQNDVHTENTFIGTV